MLTVVVGSPRHASGQTACNGECLQWTGHYAGGQGLTCLLWRGGGSAACGSDAGAGRCGAEQSVGSTPWPAQPRAERHHMTTPYLSSSAVQCLGHPDGFVTLPMGLCAHKPIKGLHRYNVESILCLLSNAGTFQLVTG